MRVRVAGAHHGPAIFEDLHVVDELAGAEIEELLDPAIHHQPDVVRFHIGDGEVVLGREADHAADAGLGFGNQQSAWENSPAGVSGFSAAKSLSKTKVEVYFGLRAPPARVFPGQR